MSRVLFVLLFLLPLQLGLGFVSPVSAQVCWPQRSVSTWRCVPLSGTCNNWSSSLRNAGVTCALGTCSSAAAGCQWIGTVRSCSYISEVCTETTQTLTYGCWGAGATPTPGLSCGDATRGSGEDCSNCPADCGVCPTADLTCLTRAVINRNDCEETRLRTQGFRGDMSGLNQS